MSKTPTADDFRELLEANHIEEKDIMGVCIHVMAKGVLYHWHYITEADMGSGRWKEVIS